MARDADNEVRLGYEEALGEELGSLFAELWHELTSLHLTWSEYRVIFATSPEQLKVANDAASGFFYIVQKIMWEAILLNLARITDPAQSPGKKKNLTVAALAASVKQEIRPDVEKLILQATSHTDFARDWRNRYLAHRDLPLALGDSEASHLKTASRASVTKALASLGELLNFVDRSYTDSTTRFETNPTNRGAKQLLFVLERGSRALDQDKLGQRRRWAPE